MKLFLLVCAIGCLGYTGAQKKFRFDYDYHQEVEGWLKLHRIPATWKNAYLTCYHEGAVLPSPENKKFGVVMRKILTEKEIFNGIFTGIHANLAEGHYTSIEGTPLSKIPINWAAGEPDNKDNSEACLVLRPHGTMADVNCEHVYPFICYKKETADLFVSACGTTDPGYEVDTRTGSCYKFHPEPQTWPRAFAACVDEGGYLAVINSDTEARVLTELYEKHPESSMPGRYVKNTALVGYRDFSDHGLWMTIQGQTIEQAGYGKWRNGDPDNNGDRQFCGGIFRTGFLDDIQCDLPCPFICEKNRSSLLPANLPDIQY